MEDFIKSSEELIEKSKIGYTQVGPTTDIENKIKIKIYKQEIKSLDFEIMPVADGSVEIQVSEDDMIVTADFYPPSGGGKPIEEEDVRNNLMRFGIVYGVDWNTIKSTIVKCNYELVQINDFVIARGDVPVDEEPPHLDIEEHLLENPEWTADEDSLSLDYKQFTPYILVKKGEPLAQAIPIKKGKFAFPEISLFMGK